MKRLLPVVIALVCCTARFAAADPVILTGGFMSIYPDGFQDSFRFTAPGFEAGGSGEGTSFSFAFTGSESINLTQSFSLGPSALDPGFFTTGGTTTNGYVGGTFQLDAVPFATGDFTGAHSFQTDFVLTGTLDLFEHPWSTSAIATTSIAGSGTAQFSARAIGAGRYLTTSALVLNLNGPAPSPTPEPAALLLLGSGLAGVLARRRARQG